MGEKSNMFFCYRVLLQFTQQTQHWYFTASKGEAVTVCGLDLEMNPRVLGLGARVAQRDQSIDSLWL